MKKKYLVTLILAITTLQFRQSFSAAINTEFEETEQEYQESVNNPKKLNVDLIKDLQEEVNNLLKDINSSTAQARHVQPAKDLLEEYLKLKDSCAHEIKATRELARRVKTPLTVTFSLLMKKELITENPF